MARQLLCCKMSKNEPFFEMHPPKAFVGLVGALKSSQNDSLCFRMVGIMIPVILR